MTTQRPTKSIAVVITIAKFRRPENPRKCSTNRYHVWHFDALREKPQTGALCQCKAIPW